MIKFKQKNFTSYEEFLAHVIEQKQRDNSSKLSSGALDSEIRLKAGKMYDEDVYLREHPEITSKSDFINKALQRVKDNDPFATKLFKVSEKRQGIHENCQIEYLSAELSPLFNNNYQNMIKTGVFHPASGTLFVNNGVFSKNKGKTEGIDLQIIYAFKNEVFYCYGALKHIDGHGTAQNNQFSKLEEFAAEFKKVNNEDIYTVSVLDGTYFKNKLFDPYKELKKYTTIHNNSGNSNSIRGIIRDDIINWLEYKFPDDKDAKDEINRLKRINIK